MEMKTDFWASLGEIKVFFISFAFMCQGNTVKDLLHSIEINYFRGDNNIIATFTINTKY